ncbi:MAG: hypothetical protein Q4B26_03740, partial [Eubacteriales bacterium]|nr:hypothetical protein [Eubacteriales bacterium]
MKIGLIDVDGHRYPNIPLMKLSAWHRQQGDTVEWYSQMFSGHLDAVYMSKVFSFTQDYYGIIDADNIIRGGTGYCIELVDGKEVYRKEKDHKLPAEIEHIYPDYSLYPERTKDTAFGFLSRGCPRQCNFGHVAAKEGCQSKKVADLSEFFDGTKRNINLCDPNILACNEWEDLLGQLVESKAYIDFNQGIDVRLATAEKIDYLNRMKIKRIHLAWDNPKQDLAEHFKRFSELYRHKHESSKEVFVLTNFNSTLEED